MNKVLLEIFIQFAQYVFSWSCPYIGERKMLYNEIEYWTFCPQKPSPWSLSYEKMNHQQLTRIISNGPYPESSKCYMKTCLWPFGKFCFWPQNAVVFIGKDEYWINKNNKKWGISEMKNNWKSFLNNENRLFSNIHISIMSF